MRISAKDLSDKLKAHGFKVLGARSKYLVLRKGAIQIIIPNESSLAPNVVHTILSQAKLSAESKKEIIKPEKKKVIEEPKINKPARAHREHEDDDMSFMHKAWEAESHIFTLGVYRILIGILFLTSAFSKAPWSDFGWFGQVVQNAIDYPTFGFIGSFMANTVQPNLAAFGWIVFVVEALIGISLILGLFTVASSFFGTFYVIVIWMVAASWPTEWAWTYIMLVFSMILFWTVKAGRSLGVDQGLVDKAEAYSEHSSTWAFIKWMV